MVANLIGKGFQLSSVTPIMGTKLLKKEALDWLLDSGSDYPPYYIILHSKNHSNFIKVQNNGTLVSNFMIEPFIIDFMKNIYSYKRVKRPFKGKSPFENFDNSYFALNSYTDFICIKLKSRFESQKSYWAVNRKSNCLYLIEDELVVLRDLCRIIKPESVECFFNSPLSEKGFYPILRHGLTPLFKGNITLDDFVHMIEILVSKSFPISLVGLKSFIVSQDSMFVFHNPKAFLDHFGLEILFKDLRDYCFDFFYLINSSHGIIV